MYHFANIDPEEYLWFDDDIQIHATLNSLITDDTPEENEED